MDTPFVPHDTFSFESNQFQLFVDGIIKMSGLIPDPPALTNAELKKKAKMADIREAEATLIVEIFKHCTSFLPPNLAHALMYQKLTSYKQAKLIDTETIALAAALWAHGDLAGAELLIMLSLAEKLANVHAELGNKEAIAALNKLDNLKRNRGGKSKGKNDEDNAKPDVNTVESKS
jgi:hypothetical protein